MTVRFFLDEDVQVFLAEALRARGVDAAHVYEAARGGEDDAPQLVFAASEGRCLVTYNKRDYALLWAAWMEAGREHYGIVVAKRSAPGNVLGALMRIASRFSSEELKNQIVYI